MSLIKQIFRIYLLSFSDLPKRAWLLSAVVLVNRSGSMVLFFLTLYLTTQLGYTIAEAGRMISIYGAGSLAGAFLGGWLSDRFGPSRVQLLSLLFGGIFFIILAYVSEPLHLAFIIFMAALTNESFRPANATAFAEACPPEVRTRGFALNRLAINLGVSIGPAVGGFLAVYNYKLIFWADGLTCLFAAGLFMLILSREGLFGRMIKKSSSGSSFSAIKDVHYLIILLLTYITSLLFTQIFNTWPLYLREKYRLAEDETGILLALNALIVAMVEMPLVHRLERFQPLKLISLGSLFLFGGFAILPFSSSYAYAIFTVMVWTIGEMLIFPQLGGFIANRAQDHNRGSYMGLYSFSFSLSFIMGPAMGAFVYDAYGGEVLWYALGVTGILVWIGFSLVEKLLNRNKTIHLK